MTNEIKREQNFPDWYQYIISTADMAENSPVRGCMIIKPWGYGIWEQIQSSLDKRIKETGHDNCYFPMLIPLHMFEKEAEHVDGFAKEMALVTHTRLKAKDDGSGLEIDGKLEEPLVIRPTSETVISEYFSKNIQSYRDLPLLINQWANVMRWEMRTRMFLRTSEFLWQEGHTAHASRECAEEETLKMLGVYRELMEEVMAIPVYIGKKSEDEKFPGAVDTYTCEAMMQDGKAVQMGTSHYLGTTFAKAENIQFQNDKGEMEYAHTTSWGVSTRLIGGLIMTHGDDLGLRVPPRIAPQQVVIVPILRDTEDDAKVMTYAQELTEKLMAQNYANSSIRVRLDKRLKDANDKRWEWVRKGTPIVIEIGPKDVEKNSVCYIRRDSENAKKAFMNIDAFVSGCADILSDIQKNMYYTAREWRDDNTVTDISDWEGFKKYFKKPAKFIKAGGPGFVLAPWSGDIDETNAKIKDMAVTIRCLPLDKQENISGNCVITGKPAKHMAIFGRSY